MGQYAKNTIGKMDVLITLLTVLLLIFISVGIAKASIPNSATGKIEACRLNAASVFAAQGTLRAIDSQSGQTCTTSETPVSWDAQLSSTVKVLSNHLEVAYNTINQPVFTIPGFGELTASCTGSSLTDGFSYKNTTTFTVLIDGQQRKVLPGQTTLFEHASNSPKTYMLAYGNGVGSKNTTLVLASAHTNISPYFCTMGAVATVNSN